MQTRSQAITFVELHVLLVSEEAAIDKQLKRDEVFNSPSTLLAQSHNNPRSQNFNPNSGCCRGSFSGKNKSSGRGESPQSGNSSPFNGRGRGILPLPLGFNGGKMSLDTSSSRIVGQICLRVGHTALDCFNRINYSFQGRHPPAQLAAMVAHQNYAHVNP